MANGVVALACVACFLRAEVRHNHGIIRRLNKRTTVATGVYFECLMQTVIVVGLLPYGNNAIRQPDSCVQANIDMR